MEEAEAERQIYSSVEGDTGETGKEDDFDEDEEEHHVGPDGEKLTNLDELGDMGGGVQPDPDDDDVKGL